MKYLCLLRGVNVGGKNTVSMAELKSRLTEAGFENVLSYINSGNILLESDMPADAVARTVEDVITKGFKLDSQLVKVRAIMRDELEKIIKEAPKGFGTKPDTYYSDVAFMLDVPASELMKVTTPNSDIDTAWEGETVVYFQRLGAQRTKSRMSKIVGTPAYKCTTIRTWNTTIKLLQLMQSPA